jgi:uncharacterized protein YggT (Ycf19 family)
MKKIFFTLFLTVIASTMFCQSTVEAQNGIADIISLKMVIEVIIVLIVTIFISLYFNKQNITKQVESRVSSLVNRNKETIREVIRNEEIDFKVRNMIDFLVIVPTEDRKTAMENLFDSLKFGEKLKVEVRESYITTDKADVFIFDMMHNPSVEFSNVVSSYVSNNDKLLGVVLSDSQLKVVNNNRDKLTAANSEFVLYARILELGRYLYALKLKK